MMVLNPANWANLPPVFPSLVVSQWLAWLSWAMVLAWVGAALSGRCRLSVRRRIALVLAAWTLLPGGWSPDYWLGLTFRIPSLTTDVLVGFLLLRAIGPAAWSARLQAPLWHGALRHWAVVGVLLGYLLLFDTLALLPWQIYRWGFSPWAVLGLLGTTLLPWALSRPTHGIAAGPSAGVLAGFRSSLLPSVLLLYAVFHLPSGNVWDALLDPCLWIALQVLWVRRVWPAKLSVPLRATRD